MTMAEVFLTEEEALKLMFPNQHGSGKKHSTFHRTRRQSSRVALAGTFRRSRSKSISARPARTLMGALVQKHHRQTQTHDVYGWRRRARPGLQCRITRFREARGSEVRTKRFNVQYEGKSVLDPVRINKDIINISGATMSVRSDDRRH